MADKDTDQNTNDTADAEEHEELRNIVAGLSPDELSAVRGMVSDEAQKRSGAASEAELGQRLGNMTEAEFREYTRKNFGYGG